MTKIAKNDIINVITTAFLSALFTWVFSILTESFEPIIILYTILSTLGVLILFHGIEKLLIKIYEKGGYLLKYLRAESIINGETLRSHINVKRNKLIAFLYWLY